MRDIKVAHRYAKSLLGIAKENNLLEELYKDMHLVNDVCSQNRDLELLLKSPIVKTDKKRAILNEIFDKNISEISRTFIHIILTKKREGILSDIATAFIDVYKTEKHIKTAQITTAIPLSKSQKEHIVSLVKKVGDSEVELNETINPEIIGGMIIRVGDKQIDESIKRKLKNLEMEFDENPYVREY